MRASSQFLFLFIISMASKDLPTLSSDSLGYLEHLAFICSASYCYERIMDMTCGRPCRVIQNTFTPLKTFHSHLTESAAVVGILNYRDYPSTLVTSFISLSIHSTFNSFLYYSLVCFHVEFPLVHSFFKFHFQFCLFLGSCL